LNDDFDKLPKSLKNIIEDEEKRKKLIIYINPPYAEATSATTISGTGQNKDGVAKEYKNGYTDIGNASNEIFAHFFVRIYSKIDGCKIANFSKLKILQSQNFSKFREVFLAKLEKMFICPSGSFDNVKAGFPIGFFIWDTSRKEKFKKIKADVYDISNISNKKSEDKNEVVYKGKKRIYCYDNEKGSINEWIKIYDTDKENAIGFIGNYAPDFQHANQPYIELKKGTRHVNYFGYSSKNSYRGLYLFCCPSMYWTSLD